MDETVTAVCWVPAGDGQLIGLIGYGWTVRKEGDNLIYERAPRERKPLR